MFRFKYRIQARKQQPTQKSYNATEHDTNKAIMQHNNTLIQRYPAPTVFLFTLRFIYT